MNISRALERKYVTGIEYIYDGNKQNTVNRCAGYWLSRSPQGYVVNNEDSTMEREWIFLNDRLTSKADMQTDYGHLATSARYANFHFHMEIYSEPGYEGQQRGSNSGLMLFDNEIQILNTCTYDNNITCGALYRTAGVGEVGFDAFKKSKVVGNLGYLANNWNVYDVFCTGEKKETNEKTRLFLFINGIPVYEATFDTYSKQDNNNELPGGLTGTSIRVQCERCPNPPSFRNMWVAPMTEAQLNILGNLEDVPKHQQRGLSYGYEQP